MPSIAPLGLQPFSEWGNGMSTSNRLRIMRYGPILLQFGHGNCHHLPSLWLLDKSIPGIQLCVGQYACEVADGVTILGIDRIARPCFEREHSVWYVDSFPALGQSELHRFRRWGGRQSEQGLQWNSDD